MRRDSTNPTHNCPYTKLSRNQLIERLKKTSKKLDEKNQIHQKWKNRREIEITDKKANEKLYQYVTKSK